MASPNNRIEATEQMFAAVGRAITQWSFVEAELSGLFIVCIADGLPRGGGLQFVDKWFVANQVFYALESFNAKRAIVDAALAALCSQVFLGDPWMTEWAKLSDKGRRLSSKRNKLAHWFVLPAQPTGTGADGEPISPPRLMPPYRSPKYFRETGLNPDGIALKPIHIGHIETAFRLYARKVREFTIRLVSEEALRDRSSRIALRRLAWDDRLDPLLLAEIQRVLASPE